MKLEELLPAGSFLGASHFYGVVIGYRGEKVLFYQDEPDLRDSGYIELEKDDLISDIMSTQEVELNTRGAAW